MPEVKESHTTTMKRSEYLQLNEDLTTAIVSPSEMRTEGEDTVNIVNPTSVRVQKIPSCIKQKGVPSSSIDKTYNDSPRFKNVKHQVINIDG